MLNSIASTAASLHIEHSVQQNGTFLFLMYYLPLTYGHITVNQIFQKLSLLFPGHKVFHLKKMQLNLTQYYYR